MSTGTFIDANDPRWLAHLCSSPHDLYHLPAYAEIEAAWIGAQATAYLYRENEASMLLVLLERPLPNGQGTDAVTPYGYSGPITSLPCDPSFMQRAFAAYHSSAQQRGILTTFMRLHPLLVPRISMPPSIPAGSWVEEERGVTLTMPLGGDDTAFFNGMARGHRAAVRRLRDAGARLVMDTAQVWNAFPCIYRHTMEKVHASPGYFYSDDYLDRFRRDLEGVVHCAGIADSSDQVMCAGLFTKVGATLQYHLSGTADGFTKQEPMKLLLAEMRGWALKNGINSFHLGGGLGGKRDTLYQFKQRFRGSEHEFRTVSIVHDDLKYKALTTKMAEKQGISSLVASEFFPRYRAPDLASDA